jgi:hypothetical protein
MTHVLFILVALATIALSALGIIPPDAFVEVIKWTVIVYAGLMAVGILTAAGARVHEANSLRAGPVFDSCFPTTTPVFYPPTDPQIPWGSLDGGAWGGLDGGVFSNPIGAGVPAKFTNFVRSSDAPPTMTDAGDGSEIAVPLETDVAIRPHPPGWSATAMPGHAEPREDLDGNGDRTAWWPDSNHRLFYDGDPREVSSREAVVHGAPRNRGLAEREKRAREANAEPNIVVLGDDGEIPVPPTT